MSNNYVLYTPQVETPLEDEQKVFDKINESMTRIRHQGNGEPMTEPRSVDELPA